MVACALPVLACSSGEGEPEIVATSTTTTVPAVEAAVDWTARTVSIAGTALGVAFCEGDAPLLCVSSADGAHLGVIEHLDADPVDDLAAFATDHALSALEDRAAACDPAFEVMPDAAAVSTLFGERGVRYSWTGSIGDVVVERTVGHAANVDGRLHLVAATFLVDEGGCLARESELPIDAIDDVEPIIDAVAAGSSR